MSIHVFQSCTQGLHSIEAFLNESCIYTLSQPPNFSKCSRMLPTFLDAGEKYYVMEFGELKSVADKICAGKLVGIARPIHFLPRI